MIEVWAPIPSAPGYAVSNTGRVRGPRGDLSTPATKRGYLTCSLRINGTKVTTTVQRVVLEAFVGPAPSATHQANHKNGVKNDNRPENLEWVTRLENMQHARDTGLWVPQPKRQRPPEEDNAGQLWQSVVVLDAHGEVMHRVDLYVPAGSARCDQHAALIDGDRALMTATQIGTMVRGWIAKRPSVALVADIRREQRCLHP